MKFFVAWPSLQIIIYLSTHAKKWALSQLIYLEYDYKLKHWGFCHRSQCNGWETSQWLNFRDGRTQLTLEGCQQDWCELHHWVPGDLGRRKYPTDWSPSCISRAHRKYPILSEVIMCFWKYPLIAYIFVITKGKRAIANCIDETIVRNDKRWPYSEGASTYFKL